MDDKQQTPLNPTPIVSKSSNKKKLMTFGVVLVVLVLIAVLAAILLPKNNKDGSTTDVNKPAFTDWLKPNTELKVGSYRYVSPCQVLPEDDVAKIYGNLTTESIVREKYVDESVPSENRRASIGQEVSCDYDYLPTTGQNVEVKLAQVADSDGATNRSVSGAAGLVEDYVAAGLKSLEAADLQEAEATTFLDKLKKSAQTFQEYNRSPFDNGSKTTLQSAILPSESGFRKGELQYYGIFENVVVRLTHELADPELGSDQPKPTTKELEAELIKIKKSFAVIEKNLANKTLSQSPAPTVRGSTNKVGDTPVLEACRVLDAATFTAITGLKQNNPVERTGLPGDLTIERKTSKGELRLARNACTRQYSATILPDGTSPDPRYGKGGYVSSEVNIYHAKNKQQAAQQWKKFEIDRKLKTKADQAGIWESSLFGAAKGSFFLVGPYIVSLDIDGVKGSGAIGDSGKDVVTKDSAFTRAINVIVANIHDIEKQKQ